MNTTFVTTSRSIDEMDVAVFEVSIIMERGEWALTRHVEFKDAVTITHKPSGLKVCSFADEDFNLAVEMLDKLPVPALGLPMSIPMDGKEAQEMRRDARFAPCGSEIIALIRSYVNYLF